MSVQTTYNFATPVGNPGGIFDLADYISISRNNSENDGVLKYGVGVFADGDKPGKAVKLPADGLTIFEGVVMNTGTAEMDKYGVVSIPNKATVGVMSRGRIWVRMYSNAAATYGAGVYLVTAGKEVGTFCTAATEAADGDSDFACAPINGKFITFGHDGVEAIDFFGGCAIAETTGAVNGLPLAIDADTLTDGQVLKYDGTDEAWVNDTDAT